MPIKKKTEKPERMSRGAKVKAPTIKKTSLKVDEPKLKTKHKVK